MITKFCSERIAKYAFEYAYLNNRKKVTAVHKANIMKLADGLFLESCREVATKYPGIKYNEIIVDNCCMQLVSKPEQFDVMVCCFIKFLRTVAKFSASCDCFPTPEITISNPTHLSMITIYSCFDMSKYNFHVLLSLMCTFKSNHSYHILILICSYFFSESKNPLVSIE